MSETVQHIEDFRDYMVLIDKLPCVVKFTAKWCYPCNIIAPVYQELSVQYGDKLKFFEVNIDSAKKITDHENVGSIPLFIFYNNGERKNDFSVLGANEHTLKEKMNEFLSMICVPVEEQPVPNEETEMISSPSNNKTPGVGASPNEREIISDELSKLKLDDPEKSEGICVKDKNDDDIPVRIAGDIHDGGDIDFGEGDDRSA